MNTLYKRMIGTAFIGVGAVFLVVAAVLAMRLALGEMADDSMAAGAFVAVFGLCGFGAVGVGILLRRYAWRLPSTYNAVLGAFL